MAATYAISDLHGRYDLWSKARDYLQEDDTLICLGDCIDRGPDGIKIVDEMRARPNTIYIKGNHEDMAAAAIYDLNEVYNKQGEDGSSLWFYNGGYATYKELIKLPTNQQLEYAYFFNNLTHMYEYINSSDEKVILVHANFTPEKKKQDLLWDRSSFHTLWPKGKNYKDIKVIHGHTPVQYLEFNFGYNGNTFTGDIDTNEAFDRWEPHAIWYCGGHKCDIDLGTAASSKTMLLNLDTWEEIYFIGD